MPGFYSETTPPLAANARNRSMLICAESRSARSRTQLPVPERGSNGLRLHRFVEDRFAAGFAFAAAGRAPLRGSDEQPDAATSDDAWVLCTIAALGGYRLTTLSPLEGAHLSLGAVSGLIISQSVLIVVAFVTRPLFGWLGNDDETTAGPSALSRSLLLSVSSRPAHSAVVGAIRSPGVLHAARHRAPSPHRRALTDPSTAWPPRRGNRRYA